MNKDFLDMLHALSDAGVKYLIVGAYAVTAYSEPRATGDIDVWVEPSEKNAVRVCEALRVFGAPMQNISTEELAQPGIVFQFGVAPVRIDIMTSIDGVTFEAAWGNRSSLTVGDREFPLIGWNELVENKKATGRPKDLLDLDLLEKHRPNK